LANLLDFFIGKIEYFIVAAGLLVSFYVIEGSAGSAGKNYGDITQLVKQYKQVQQATNIKK
jgi:hypothetical protein